MTIASKLRVFTLLLLVISVAFAYSFWKTSNNLKNQRNINNIIQAIIKNTFQFSIISDEYINNNTLRIQTQWGNSHVSLEKTIYKARNILFFKDDLISLKKISSNEEQAEELILGLIQSDKKNIRTRKKIQHMSQIRVRIQGMLSESSRMSLRSLERLTAAEKQLEFTSALLISIYFFIFILAVILINKKILNPIVNLQKNAKQLAQGDYNSRIPIVGKDEISALALSYNLLATDIQKKISHLTLRSEELVDSQKELVLFNNNLQNMIDEQTADLRNSEHKQRIILDSMTDGIITLDSDHVIQDVNPAASNMFGYTSRDYLHKKIVFIISNLEEVADNYGQFYEKEGHHKMGHRFPIKIALNKLLVNDRLMYSCIIRDITEQKRVQKMQVEFVSNVSHELRTPLTSIRGALGLVTSGALDELPEKANELLTTAYRNTDRLMHLINDLLDMQKIEAGKLDFNVAPLNLAKAMEKALVDNIGYTKQHNVKIEIGDVVSTAIIKADPLRLDQIMSNLLSNAAKFSPDNSSIIINSSIESPYAKISVIDSGEGIPEEFFDTIFSKFTQNDASATRQKGGTGLGLAITKQMVEAMHGSIDFTSSVGKGTTFNIRLPLAE